MEKMLVNIVEYLALGELENYLSSEHPHQQVFYDAMEREAIMQQVLNRVPAVYMWLAPDECPSRDQLNPAEQELLRSVVREVVHQKLQQAPLSADPYAGSMSEAFYG